MYIFNIETAGISLSNELFILINQILHIYQFDSFNTYYLMVMNLIMCKKILNIIINGKNHIKNHEKLQIKFREKNNKEKINCAQAL